MRVLFRRRNGTALLTKAALAGRASRGRAIRSTLVSVLLAAFAIAAVGSPAQAVSFYSMSVWSTDRCIDSALENGATIQLWSCNRSAQQAWLEGFNQATGNWSFVNGRSGLCLDATQPGPGRVIGAPCEDLDVGQRWKVLVADNPLGPPTGWYQVWQNFNGFCLYAPNLDPGANGTLLRTAACNVNNAGQRFHTGDL